MLIQYAYHGIVWSLKPIMRMLASQMTYQSACPWDQQPTKDVDPMDHARRGSSASSTELSQRGGMVRDQEESGNLRTASKDLGLRSALTSHSKIIAISRTGDVHSSNSR